jgi:sigma-B regulation protein RsbU (phosphoserine phosphatase)
VAALNDPGRQVSGDYYDVISLEDGRVGILIADVTGKGVASSLLMANLQAAVRVTLDGERPLDELLGLWNALIYGNTDAGKFVTCLVAIVDPRQRTVSLANAGHYLPYVVTSERKHTWQIQVPGGVPLGLMSPAEYFAHSIELSPDPCTLFFFTDGVLEAVDGNDEFFGMDQTLDVLCASADLDPERMVSNMRSCITRFAGSQPQSDDITMVAVHLP